MLIELVKREKLTCSWLSKASTQVIKIKSKTMRIKKPN